MNFRTLLTMVSMALLLGASACSTTEGAQTDASAQTTEQSQNVEVSDAAAPEDAQASATQDMQANPKHARMKEICPMQVEGTTRAVTKLDDAVAMDFTTTSGDVDELRARVQKMSQMHGQMHGNMHAEMKDAHGKQPAEMKGKHAKMRAEMKGEQGKMNHGMKHGEMTEEQRQMHKQMKQLMADVTVSTEELDAGMRLKLTPKDATQVDALYAMMQKRSEMMGEHGQCPMKMMGTDTAEQPQD